MGCQLIVAAFSRNHTDLSGFVSRSLEGRGLRVTRMEPVQQGVLVFAESHSCDSLNMLRLREELVTAGEQAGVRFRVQREDLFRAMHRLESPAIF